MHPTGAILLALSLAVAACAPVPEQQEKASASGGRDQTVFHVATLIQEHWRELVLRGRTDYRVTVMEGRPVLRAQGRVSASGVIREVEADVERCPQITWSWRVDQLQSAADLYRKDKDDVAASIFLLFGDPGLLAAPDPVPTLRYVWTTARHPEGTIVDSPYLPGVVRSLVVRSGPAALGQWMIEQRNVLDDFHAAFGRMPEEDLFAIALFTDNDQTQQPVVAFYEWIRLRCGRG